MTQAPPTNDPKTDGGTTARRHMLVRPGTWLWSASGSESDNNELLRELVAALRKDSRVIEVRAPEQNDFWTSRISLFPDRQRSSRVGLSTGRDAFDVLHLSRPIMFQVRIPIKNQHAHAGTNDIPSDTYFVTWDGVSVFILWEQDDENIPISGGHVVAEVLDDALDAVDSALYVQSCNPGCEYMFLHQTIQLLEDSEVDDFEIKTGKRDQEVLVTFDELDDPSMQVIWVALSLGGAMENFAEFKNYGRRLIDLEHACRLDLGHLLTHYADHAELVHLGWKPKYLRLRWRNRGWRKEARSLVASVWLALANIESVRRRWDQERLNIADDAEYVPLFSADFSRDVVTIDSLRLEPVSENVNQIAGWLDNRAVVWATSLGALAGGLAGGAATLIGS